MENLFQNFTAPYSIQDEILFNGNFSRKLSDGQSHLSSEGDNIQGWGFLLKNNIISLGTKHMRIRRKIATVHCD